MNINFLSYACLGQATIRAIKNADTEEIAIITPEQHLEIERTNLIPEGLEWSKTPPNCPIHRFNGQVLEVDYARSSKTNEETQPSSTEESLPDSSSEVDSSLVDQLQPDTTATIGQDKEKVQCKHKPHHVKPVATSGDGLKEGFAKRKDLNDVG